MEIWKITYRTLSGEREGFSYGRTKKEAVEFAIHKNMEIEKAEKIQIEYSERGIISALNIHASHPDNG